MYTNPEGKVLGTSNPAIYSRDLHCHHTAWAYRPHNSDDGELFNWFSHKLTSTVDFKVPLYTFPDETLYTHDQNSLWPFPVA